MSNKPLILAVPKGRILKELDPIFKKANIVPEDDFFDDSSRKLIFKTNSDNLNIIRVRSFDVATFVKFGAAHLGVCGYDVLEEFKSQDFFTALDLKIGKCRLSIAGIKGADHEFKNRSHLKIATKYPNITQKYFAKRGISAEYIKLNGAMELAPHLNLCEFIVDLVSTGNTLKENNLSEISSILEVTSHLIINRAALKTRTDEVNEIVQRF